MPKVDGAPSAPTAGTLRKYGLSAAEWLAICRRQGFVCPVCNEPFGERKLVVDHAHVRRFRRMRPADKKLHVRGVLHSFCNRYVRGWLTLVRARGIVAYLENFERRRAENKPEIG